MEWYSWKVGNTFVIFESPRWVLQRPYKEKFIIFELFVKRGSGIWALDTDTLTKIQYYHIECTKHSDLNQNFKILIYFKS